MNEVEKLEDERCKVASMMLRFGGGFIHAMAECVYRADSKNLRKIRGTWPDEWKEYLGLYGEK